MGSGRSMVDRNLDLGPVSASKEIRNIIRIPRKYSLCPPRAEHSHYCGALLLLLLLYEAVFFRETLLVGSSVT